MDGRLMASFNQQSWLSWPVCLCELVTNILGYQLKDTPSMKSGWYGF